jgi:hypothetical protein
MTPGDATTEAAAAWTWPALSAVVVPALTLLAGGFGQVTAAKNFRSRAVKAVDLLIRLLSSQEMTTFAATFNNV